MDGKNNNSTLYFTKRGPVKRAKNALKALNAPIIIPKKTGDTFS
jgi:predicted RNase H-like nuclease